jgi:hypothetical protein
VTGWALAQGKRIGGRTEMHLEFEGFSIHSIGDLITEDRFGWVRIVLQFRTTSPDTKPSLEIRVPVQYERGWTINQVREASFEKVREVLLATNEHMEKYNLEGLQRLHDEREKEEVKKMAEEKQIIEQVMRDVQEYEEQVL